MICLCIYVLFINYNMSYLMFNVVYVCVTLFTFITSTPSNYTFTFLYTTAIGNKNTPITFITDTTVYDTILFSNTDRPYAQPILTGTDLDLYKDNIQINNLLLQNFTFSIKEDPTNLNITSIQGILGLGISSRTKHNEIISALQKQQLINKGIIFLSTTPSPQLSLFVDKPQQHLTTFTNCSLLDSNELIDKKYHDSWICDYSHVLIVNKSDTTSNGVNTSVNLSWNDTVEIHGRVLFDSTTSYIIIPNEYIDVIIEMLGVTSTECKREVNRNYNETYLNCYFEKGITYLNELNDFYFLFEGYAYKLSASDLFVNVTNDKEFISKIKFREEHNNIWIFGYPFFAKYEIAFDYDDKKVCIKGGDNVLNLTTEYMMWKKENEDFLKMTFNDKNVIIIGAIIGCVILLVILILIIRAFIRKNNPQVHSSLVEDIEKNKQINK